MEVWGLGTIWGLLDCGVDYEVTNSIADLGRFKGGGLAIDNKENIEVFKVIGNFHF
jgi:hypothetical protein